MRSQAFWFLAILVGLPFPIMTLVNVERGRTEGAALAQKLEDLSKLRDSFLAADDDNLSQATRDELESSYSYQRS